MLLNNTQENQKLETDILIIGAGPVGIFAAFQAGILGMKSIIVDSLKEMGGQPAALYPNKYIYDIPGFPKILAKDLIKNLYEQASVYKPIYLLEQNTETLIKNNNEFKVITSKNNEITAKAIIIAAGSGTFTPQRLPISGIEKFENNTILYSIKDPDIFKGKDVVIIGGGDSAIDWSLHLSNIAKKVYLIHRRQNLRALPASVNNILKLNKQDHFNFLAPYVVKSVYGKDTKVYQITLEHFVNKETKSIKVDYILPFFGLTRTLGEIANWGLNIDRINSTILTDPVTGETNIKGIFAVGDIAKYDHKLKLIMVGFSEVAYALHASWKYVFPNKVFNFCHSTSKN